ncbi:MAG: site-2 protease family protein [Candidatus Peribacteraceae bacterium]|jgi:Zn-dependent protease|nr:site-2 protease family protein [Candidatus Peribacteraceae bacterium]MDP7477043.1 site-2 protease family protein [Candidatus Peribacteraceae bacterium]
MFDFSPTFIIAILIAVSVHEWAHGYAAYKLGDPTAKYDGRLTLNPLAHLDPVGTVLFIMVGFGWGKPVPVDPRYFKRPLRDNAIVAFAGPLSNIILAFGAFAIAVLIGQKAQALSVTGALIAPNNQPIIITFLGELLGDIIHINLVLMAFNLLPVPPLDGSKILRMFLPYEFEYQYRQFEQYGPWILLGLIFLGRAVGLPILSLWISIIMAPFLGIMYALI